MKILKGENKKTKKTKNNRIILKSLATYRPLIPWAKLPASETLVNLMN